MILTKGTKELLINAAANFPFIFTKPDAGNPNKEAVATAADATKLRIKGFADSIFLASLTGSVLAQRAQNEVVGSISIDPAQASQILVSGTNVAGATATIELEEKSIDPLPEYMTNTDKYRRTRVYSLVLPAAATAAQVLSLLADQINGRAVLFPEADEPATSVISASLNAGVLTVTASDSHISLRLYVHHSDVATRAILPVFGSVVATPSYEGRSIYRTLKGGRLQTEGTNDAYAVPGPLELPQAGAKYTRVDFATVTARPELSNHGAADSGVSTVNKFGIYLKEGDAATEQAITDLITFLSRADAGVSKSYSDQNVSSNLTGTTKAAFLANSTSQGDM